MPRSSARMAAPERLEDLHDLPPERLLRRRILGREAADAGRVAHVGAVEADHVIDAIAVEELRAAPGPGAEPAEVVALDAVPAIRRQAPVLAFGAERVGRRADGQLAVELLLVLPDVGAVGADGERQIAEEPDPRRRPRRLPLRVGEPLQVGVEADLALQASPGHGQRRGLARAQAVGPVPPGLRREAIAERAEQDVVVEPVGLALHEAGELGDARHVPPAAFVLEAVERDTQRRLLHLADGVVIDLRRLPHGGEPVALIRGQPLHAARGDELRHVRQPQVDRIDRHRRDGGVRRVMPGRRQLVDRQHQQEIEAGAAMPRGEGHEVGDLADAPALVGRGGEQRQEHASVAFARKRGCRTGHRGP